MVESQFRLSGGKAELYSEVLIRAPPERIWEILAAFPDYPAWNPFIRSIRGELAEGGRITASLHPPGGFSMTIRPVLVTVDPPRELRWRGHLLVQGLFDGEHIFTIEPINAETIRFIQRERFFGLLLPLLQRSLRTSTARGFDAMNAALKERAENPGG